MADGEDDGFVPSKNAAVINGDPAPAEDDGFVPLPKGPPDVSAMKAHVDSNLKARDTAAAGKRETIDASPKPIKAEEGDFIDHLAAGWSTSVTGLMASAPAMSPADHMTRMDQIGQMIGQVAGDLPAMWAGSQAGGAIGAPIGGAIGSVVPIVGTLGGIGAGYAIGGASGAWAAPAGIRKLLMDHYEKGDIKDAADFSNRLVAASWESIKAGTVGAVTGGAGYTANLATIGAKPLIQAGTSFMTELSTMATASAAMEKRLPNSEDFINAGIVMAGMHGVMEGAAKIPDVSAKLRNIYQATGEHPMEIAQEAMQNPALHNEILSNNPDMPKIEMPSEEEQAKMGIPKFNEKDLGIDEKPDAPTPEQQQAKQAVEVAQDAVDKQSPQEEPAPPEPTASENLSEDEKQMLNYVGAADPKADTSASGAFKRDVVNFWRNEDTRYSDSPGYKSEFMGKAVDGLTDFYIKHFDFTKGLRRAIDQMAADPETAKNPAALATLHSEVMTKIKGFFDTSTRDFETQEPNGEAYDAIVNDYKKEFPDDKQMDKLRAYGMAKRVIEKAAQGTDIIVNTGTNPEGEAISVETAKKIVAADKGGTLEAFNQRRVDFRNRVLEYAHDSGFWTPEQFEAMKRQNESYMSFHRIQELDPMLGKTPGGSRGVFKMKGVGNLIVDPLVSDIKDTAMLIKMAEENKVKQSMVEQFATEGEDALLRKVEPDLKITKVQAKELSKEMDRQGIDHEPDDVDAMNVFRYNTAKSNENRLEINVNGERQVYEGDPEIIDIANRLKGNPPAAGMFAKMLSTAAAGIRAGTINAWAFATKHATRNQLTAATYSETGLKPFIGPAMNSLDFFAKDKPQRVRDFFNDGGAQSSYQAFDEQWIQSRISSIDKEAPFLDKAFNLVQSAAQLSHVLILNNDNLIRYSEYSRLLDEGKGRTEAAYGARRVLPDAQAAGLQHSFLLSQTAFLGIHVRGLMRQGEAISDQFEQSKEAIAQGNLPAALHGPLARAVGYITMPAAMLAAANYLNGSEERIDRLEPWQKYGYFNLAMHSWDKATDEQAAAMPHADLKRQLPDGSWEIDNGTTWRMQMPFTQGVFFGGLPQVALDMFKDKKPEHFKEWAKNVAESTVALPIPNFIEPAIAQTTNYNAFTGRPIIPENKLQLASELQYEPYTTETAKAIGKMIGRVPYLGDLGPEHQKLSSPMIVEEYARDWTGPIGMGAMKMADYALQKAGVIRDKGQEPTWEWGDYPVIGAFCWRNATAKTADIDQFVKAYQLASTNQKSVREYAKEGLPDQAMQFRGDHDEEMTKMQGPYQAIHNMKQYIQSVTANPQMSANDKRQLIDPVFYRMDEIAKAANKQMDIIQKSIQDSKTKGNN